MARKFIQVSTAINNDSTFLAGVCDDGTVWTSDNFKSWEYFGVAPNENESDTKEQNFNSQQHTHDENCSTCSDNSELALMLESGSNYCEHCGRKLPHTS